MCSAGGSSLQGPGEPVAEYRFLLATETEQGARLPPKQHFCVTLRFVPDASRSCAALFPVVHTEKTNWVLEILKLRQVEAIIALLDHATLHTYAAHALSNIASGRDGTRRYIQRCSKAKQSDRRSYRDVFLLGLAWL